MQSLQYQQLEPIIKKLSTKPSQLVIDKAEEYLRLCGHVELATMNVGKPAACLELAYRTYGLPFEADVIAKYSAVHSKQYPILFTRVQTATNAVLLVTFEDIAKTRGAVRYIELARQILTQYEQRFKAALNPVDQVKFHLRSVHTMAAYYISCQHHKGKVEKSQLLKDIQANGTEFDEIVVAMKEVCKDLIPSSSGSSSSCGSAPKRKLESLQRMRGAEEESIMDEKMDGKKKVRSAEVDEVQKVRQELAQFNKQPAASSSSSSAARDEAAPPPELCDVRKDDQAKWERDMNKEIKSKIARIEKDGKKLATVFAQSKLLFGPPVTRK